MNFKSIFILAMSLLFLTACSHPAPTAHPLSGVGPIRTHDWAKGVDDRPYVEVVYSDDGQIVDYTLCEDSPQPFLSLQTVNLSFKWDEKKRCYYVVDTLLTVT